MPQWDIFQIIFLSTLASTVVSLHDSFMLISDYIFMYWERVFFVKWIPKTCWKTFLLNNVLIRFSSLLRSVILGWPLHIQYDEFFFLFDCKDVMIKGQNKYCLFQPQKKKKDETIFLKQHDSMQKWCLCKLHIFKFTHTAKLQWNINKDQFYTVQIVTHYESHPFQPIEKRYLCLREFIHYKWLLMKINSWAFCGHQHF